MPVRIGHVRSLRTLEHVLGADPAVVRGFATAAADRFDAGPLTLDARDRLLSRGERLGLRRFDANLVLAAVEQQHRAAPRTAASPATRSPVIEPAAPRLKLHWPAAATAVAVQASIVAGLWWLLA